VVSTEAVLKLRSTFRSCLRLVWRNDANEECGQSDIAQRSVVLSWRQLPQPPRLVKRGYEESSFYVRVAGHPR